MGMGQAASAQWYVRRAGQMRGPLPYGRLSREILLGRVMNTDELSQDRRIWQALAGLPDLVPQVMRDSATEAGRQRLMLARLRVDERVQDRRRRTSRPQATERRHADRRQVALFEIVSSDPPVRPVMTGEDDNAALVMVAIVMILLFLGVLYLLW